MPTIAIIDDNKEQSGTVRSNIELSLAELGSTLKVLTTLPFNNINDYFPFIQSNEVCVIIMDEKLNDQAIDEKGAVDYKGSHLVTELRKQLKDMPIFALTVIPTEHDLVQKFSEYEQIISRSDFYNDPDKYVPIFLRAAKTYLKENFLELSLFNELTKAIAGGNESANMIEKMQALQVKLELPFSGFQDRSTWLDEYEKQIKDLETLNQLIKQKLGN